MQIYTVFLSKILGKNVFAKMKRISRPRSQFVGWNEIGAGGTWYGDISYWYGQCTPPSSRPSSLDSSEASHRTSSSSTLLVSSPFSSTLSFASSSPIVTPTPTALFPTAISLHFATLSLASSLIYSVVFPGMLSSRYTY